MSDLHSRLTNILDSLTGRDVSFSPRPAPARVQREVHYGVAVELGRGLVGAARVQAVKRVGSDALQVAVRLTALETLYLSQAPLGESRYRAIADTAAVVLANIVAETGQA